MKRILASYNIHINSFTTGCIGFMYGWLNEHNYNRDACYRFESVVGGVSMQSEPFLIEYDFDANMHRIGDYELRRGIDFVNANDGISFIYIEQCTDTDTVCFLFT